MGGSPAVSVELYVQYRAAFPFFKILEIPNLLEHIQVGTPCVEAATYGEPSRSPVDEIESYSMWIRGEWER